MKKVNILQLITGLKSGGAENLLLELVKNMDKNKFNVKVVSISKKDQLYNEYVEAGIDVNILNKESSFSDFVKAILELNKYIKNNDIELIHAHMTHSVIIASMVKLLNPKIKIVFTSHNLNIGSKTREFILFLLQPFRNYDILLSKNIIKYFYKKTFKIIPNGIKVENYNIKVKKHEVFTFIMIGRLEKQKNHKFLLEVVKELSPKYKFEIHIIGDGYLKNELNDYIKKNNLEKIVKLLGFSREIPKLLNQSHCLLLSSLWEGLPIVILEAGASRIPIITTPVGSIPSLINDKNGYLTKFDNFKRTMMNVMDNYSEALEKAEVLYKDIKNNYSIESTVKKHEELYNELLKGQK